MGQINKAMIKSILKNGLLAIFSLTVAIGLNSCKNNIIPDKPVSEPISTAELAKILKEKPDFAPLYEAVRQRYDECSTTEKSKFSSLTYCDVAEYDNFMNNKILWQVTADSIKKVNASKNSEAEDKYNALIEKWRTKKEIADHIDRYVQIITATSWCHPMIKAKNFAGFKVTAVKEPLDYVRFTWSAGVDGGDDPKGSYIVTDLTGSRNVQVQSSYMIMRPIIEALNSNTPNYYIKPNIVEIGMNGESYPVSNFNDKTHPDEINLEQGNLWMWMEIGTPGFYRIENLTINGVVYPSSVLDRMPNFIQEYYFGEFPLPRHQVVAKIIAEENINSKYISQEDFIALKTREELVKRDKEAYEFFYESGESKPSEDVIEFVKTFYNEGLYDNTDVIRSYITDKLAYKLCKLYADIYGEGVIEEDAMATWEFTRIYDDYVPQTDDGLKDIKLGENGKVTVVLKFSGVKREINLVVIDTPDGLRIDDLETQDGSWLYE